MDELLGPAIDALGEQTGQGSVQERSSLDRAMTAQRQCADKLTLLEELMVPENFKVTIPDEYKNLPALQGRATVQFELKKGETGGKPTSAPFIFRFSLVFLLREPTFRPQRIF